MYIIKSFDLIIVCLSCIVTFLNQVEKSGVQMVLESIIGQTTSNQKLSIVN